MGDVMHITVGKLLEQVAAKYPEKDAVIYHDRGLRYTVQELANHLLIRT